MMDDKAVEELILNVKSLTDRMTMVDAVLKANKLSQETVLAFQCSHSGLYYPADYVRLWGRLYGIGLGPSPVSESLDSLYYTEPPPITEAIRSIEQIMHPVGNSFAQLDYMLVSADDYNDCRLVCAHDDPHMEIRARILRDKQLSNPLSKLRIMQVAWDRTGR